MSKKLNIKNKSENSGKTIQKRRNLSTTILKHKHPNISTKEKKEVKKISNTEYEKRVIEFSKRGFKSEKIGEQLRQEGIHPKDYGKKISKILKEKNLYINPDLVNIEEKLKKVVEHYKKNKQDKRSKREKDRI